MDEKLKEWLGEAYDEASNTFRVKLRKPVTIAGEQIDTLTLSEPSLGQMEDSSKKQGAEVDRTLIALVAGVAPAIVRDLSASEYRRAMSFLNFFMAAAPPTGEPS